MSDSRLALHTADLRVKVSESVGRRRRKTEHALGIQDVDAKEVSEGAVLVVLCDEEQLCVVAAASDVGCDETWLGQTQRCNDYL